uniref:Carbonic anhydrase n=1 Tax=Exaiptasia diaphana TaxID=2652724 RepID=A0A1B0Y2E1_EXADI|nr:alpha carbonic anhydrase 4 [Exaiptasia diaphana]
MMDKVLIFVVIGLVPASMAAVTYNYRPDDKEYGPSVWNTKYNVSCAGKRQSPIHIDTTKTVYKNLGALQFTNDDKVPNGPTLQIGNNKHSYRVNLKKDYFSVKGGGLPGTFNVFSFHFHWGKDDTRGSEHTVNMKKYPAELHFVNWNTKYVNISEALKHEDGIAAIGVILEIGNDENPALASFLKYAVNVTYPKELYNIAQTHSIADLMPKNREAFYRYDGSLTTPVCQEVVTWTVFNNTMPITANQLSLLRSLKDNNATLGVALVDTHRPVQPLNNRMVYRTFDKPPVTAGCCLTPTVCLLIIMLGLFAMFN